MAGLIIQAYGKPTISHMSHMRYVRIPHPPDGLWILTMPYLKLSLGPGAHNAQQVACM